MLELSRIDAIDGVKASLLVDTEGRMVDSRHDGATAELALAIFQLGQQCKKFGKGFRYMVLSRRNGERLAVFCQNAFFLGVLMANHYDVHHCIQKISNIIQQEVAS